MCFPQDAQTLIERKLANIELEPTVSNVVIPSGDDSTSMICRALVCGNLEEAVELCLEAKRIADALLIASLGNLLNLNRHLFIVIFLSFSSYLWSPSTKAGRREDYYKYR